jgi:colanic acid/amylovoran biosynthesis glycosyltransferase
VDLKIIGGGPLETELRALAAGAANIEFLGSRDHAEVFARMLEADVVIVPSVVAASGDEEGSPTVIMEAMATGAVVVATRHSGIPEMVEHDVTGLLVAERSSKELTVALRRLCDDASLQVRLGKAARLRAEAEYDVKKLNKRLDGIYREVAGEVAAS